MDFAQINKAAHEINNQVAIILQAVAYLKDNKDPFDKNIKTTLNYIEEAAGKVNKIISGLADASRQNETEA